MRFTIEQRRLTDTNGRPINAGRELVRFHSCEAGDVDEAVRLFVRDHDAEIIGNILQFAGFQAVATMRNPEGVFTLQIAPTSQSMPLR